MLVAKLISSYIFWTLRHGIPPWRFFQLNAKYFNAEKGVYSKIEIDDLIPEQWRVEQSYLSPESKPSAYPVFLKPEWGQNSYGIKVVKNFEEFETAHETLKDCGINYIMQSLAVGEKEFEIFTMQDPDRIDDFETLTITEVINEDDEFPINAIHNSSTRYKDRTKEFTETDLLTLKSFLLQFPHFKIARFAVKTDSKKTLLSGKFNVVEINLFAPMPIHLLDEDHSNSFKNNFIIKNMKKLAIISGKASKKDFKSLLFYKIVKRHYQLK